MPFVSFSWVRAFLIGLLAALPIRGGAQMLLIWRRRLWLFTLAADGLYAARWRRVGAPPLTGARLLRARAVIARAQCWLVIRDL